MLRAIGRMFEGKIGGKDGVLDVGFPLGRYQGSWGFQIFLYHVEIFEKHRVVAVVRDMTTASKHSV